MYYLAFIFPLLGSAIFPLNLTTTDIDETSAVVHKDEKQELMSHEPDTIPCNCVAFARTKRPDIPSQNASDFAVSTTTPRVGMIALMHYPHSGEWHLAYVEGVGDGYVDLWDANYKPCEITHRRVYLPDRIVGYL